MEEKYEQHEQESKKTFEALENLIAITEKAQNQIADDVKHLTSVVLNMDTALKQILSQMQWKRSVLISYFLTKTESKNLLGQSKKKLHDILNFNPLYSGSYLFLQSLL